MFNLLVLNEVYKKASRNLLALIDGATSWTRTSDPHHVKVVL